MSQWFDWNKISFRMGLSLLGGLILAGLLGMTLRAHFLKVESKDASVARIADRIEGLTLETLRTEKDFMLRDLVDPNFYKTGETIYLGKHRSTLSSLREEIVAFAGALPAEKREEALSLLRLSDGYSENFQKLVAAYRERGSRDLELETAWDHIVTDMEGELSPSAIPETFSLLLTLKRDEESYIVKRQETHIDAVSADIEKLRKWVTQSLGGPSKRLLKDIENYDTAFSNHVLVNRRIGLTDTMGLQSDTRDSLESMLALIGDSQSEVSLKKASASAKVGVLFYTVLFLGFSLLVASVILSLKRRRAESELSEWASLDEEEPLPAAAPPPDPIDLAQFKLDGEVVSKAA